MSEADDGGEWFSEEKNVSNSQGTFTGTPTNLSGNPQQQIYSQVPMVQGDSQATRIIGLILSILASLTLLTGGPLNLIFAIPGFILNYIDWNKVKTVPDHPDRGLALTGLIINGINLALGLLFLLLVVVFIGFLAAYA